MKLSFGRIVLKTGENSHNRRLLPSRWEDLVRKILSGEPQSLHYGNPSGAFLVYDGWTSNGPHTLWRGALTSMKRHALLILFLLTGMTPAVTRPAAGSPSGPDRACTVPDTSGPGILAPEKGSRYIYPDPRNTILIVREAPPQGNLITGEPAGGDPLALKILRELEEPFHRSVIKLSQCSRNLAGNTDGPNVLYLSTSEGGFPRHGLTLKTKDTLREYPRLNYVDLVVDEERLRNGALMIFSHELGHVMMANIWEDFPGGRSPKQHVSMGITDYWMALSEGWGEHFQRLALDQIPDYQRIYREGFDYTRMNRLWHSKVDEDLRLSGVLRNEYICQKLLPGIDTAGLSLEEMILTEHTSPVFDPPRLKNAQQMLSCEGVIATLFYRIQTDSVLQHNWLQPEFYGHFLLSPAPAGVGPQDIFTPFENVMLKNFWVFRQIRGRVTSASTVFTEFIKEWGASFPDDREEIIKLFLMTTAGRTVTNELAEAYSRMARSGMVGDIENFRAFSSAFIEAYDRLKKRVLAGELALDSNVGPELWVANPSFSIRTTLWVKEEKKPLEVNLNTASLYELASFPGIGLENALKITKERDRLGYFRSFEEAKTHGWTYEEH
jgi:hypothetical protein